jgi:hypothetical protein
MCTLQQREVTQDDAEWNLFDEAVNPTELRVRQFIAPRIQAPLNGNVNAWLGVGERPSTAISAAIMMDQSRTSDDTLRYLWRGGAADCIVIAAVGDAGAFLMHATRITVATAITGVSRVGGGAQEIVGSLIDDGVEVHAIFGSGRLAINSQTGAVLSRFPDPSRIDPPEQTDEDQDLDDTTFTPGPFVGRRAWAALEFEVVSDTDNAIREIITDTGNSAEIDKGGVVAAFHRGLPYGSRTELLRALVASLPLDRGQLAAELTDEVIETYGED